MPARVAENTLRVGPIARLLGLFSGQRPYDLKDSIQPTVQVGRVVGQIESEQADGASGGNTDITVPDGEVWRLIAVGVSQDSSINERPNILVKIFTQYAGGAFGSIILADGSPQNILGNDTYANATTIGTDLWLQAGDVVRAQDIGNGSGDVRLDVVYERMDI